MRASFGVKSRSKATRVRRAQVSKWVAWRRYRPEKKASEVTDMLPSPIFLPSAKVLTRLLLQQLNTLSEYEAWLLEQLCAIPEILKVKILASDFQDMVRSKQPDSLDDWLVHCHQSQLGAFERFADNLTEDYTAVQGALATNWSNGQTEGQINRIKLLMRQMYVRAKLDLLRLRALYHSQNHRD